MHDTLPGWVKYAMDAEKPTALPQGPYTVWENFGYDGWHFTDYATLQEALNHQSYSTNRVIQKPVNFSVTEH